MGIAVAANNTIASQSLERNLVSYLITKRGEYTYPISNKKKNICDCIEGASIAIIITYGSYFQIRVILRVT